MIGKGGKPGLNLAIVLGKGKPSPESEPDDTEDEGPEESEDQEDGEGDKLKQAAADVRAALKSENDDALATALEDFIRCCKED